MGDPKRIKKKFTPPSHPWQKTRIDEEKRLKRDYAFKNKKEIWKMASKLKGFTAQAKRLNASRGGQAEKETQQLLQRLQRLGLLTDNISLDAVLDLKVENVLDRRLQSLVFRNGYANTMKQARQFITHGHIGINGVPVTAPSHLVSVTEESAIGFVDISALKDEMHPERLSKEDRIKIAAEAAAKEAAKKAQEELAAEKKQKEAAEEKAENPEAEEKAENPEDVPPENPEEAKA